MPKSLPYVYKPDPSPYTLDDVPRYLEQELNRIAQALIAQPVAMAVEEVGDYIVYTFPNWVRVFVGVAPSWDVPGGDFDSATGYWTCPQRGLYSIDANLEVQPYGSGNKNYYAGVRIYRDAGGVITYNETTDGGVDDIPLGVNLSGLIPLDQGDILAVEITIVHETFVGTAPYDIGWQILRVSGT